MRASGCGTRTGRILRRRARDGAVSIDGYAEDYAYLVWGLLELFQTSGDLAWLDWALELQALQDDLFWDHEGGGWFATTGEDPSVLLRVKEEYDGAEPAASSVAVENLLTLTHLRDDPEAAAKAEKTLGRFGTRLGQAARAVPLMMAALVRYHAPATQIRDCRGSRRAGDTCARAGRGGALPPVRGSGCASRRETDRRVWPSGCRSSAPCGSSTDAPRRTSAATSLVRSRSRTRRGSTSSLPGSDTMTFKVEVLLKGKEDVVETEVDFEGPEPAAWADDDVRRVLELTLGTFDQVQNPDAEERPVALRGFSWIVTPVDGGVAIAIEIPSGAAVAGPFEGDVDTLTATITRVLANVRGSAQPN